MQITLKQDELEIAVRQYLQKVGFGGRVGEVKFSNTRNGTGGSNQVLTEVEMNPANDTAVVEQINIPVAKPALVPEATEDAPVAEEVVEEEEATELSLGDKSLFS